MDKYTQELLKLIDEGFKLKYNEPGMLVLGKGNDRIICLTTTNGKKLILHYLFVE